jgi:geranylgeranyl reductase family protein
METFDTIIVGAGPAGSTTAYRLASAGARVLLLDKARFPRDKPCGGGVTARALRELPFDIQPVVEHTVEHLELSFRGHRGVRRGGRGPLAHMTQRRRLDHFLVEQALAAGATFRDGVRVSEISEDGVRVDGGWVGGDLVLGADGVNGASARALGLTGDRIFGVALEGNLDYSDVVDPARWQGTLTLELGTILGGYGWIFPKGNHLNVGVGGWQTEGPRLREHLRAFCARHRFDYAKVSALRGYRLAGRGPGSPLSGARALLVGEAAGLIDPLLGDGLSFAFLSARLAAETALDFLAGRNADLRNYDRAVISEIGPTACFALDAKRALDRLPWLVMVGVLSQPGWGVIEKMVRGELSKPEAERGLEGAAIWGLEVLAGLAGRPGEAYRTEIQEHRAEAISSSAHPQTRTTTRNLGQVVPQAGRRR